MTHTLISLLSILLGLLSSNIFAFFYKKYSLGYIANSICGVYGSIFFVKFFGKLGFSPEFVVVDGEYFIVPMLINFVMSIIGGISIFLFVSLLREQVRNRSVSTDSENYSDIKHIDNTESIILEVNTVNSEGNHQKVIHNFKILSWVEWSSYIILICLSVNKRFFAGEASYVSVFGRVHGFLFVAYILFATYLWIRLKWTLVNYLLVNLMSLLPFGAFILHKFINKK